MLRKRWIALAVLLVSSTAVTSWAATVYQVQTKLATAGGTLKVANKAVQTVAGSTVFHNFTTAAAVPVTVNASTGYTISSIYKTGVKQTVADPKIYSVNFFKAGGSTQSLIAYFAVQKSTVTSTVTGSGSVSPAAATVDYNKSVTLTATPQFSNAYVDAVTVDGAPYSFTAGAGSKSIVLSSVTANKAVAVTFKTVTVEAGNNKVGDVNAGTALRGSVTGAGTLLWSQVSGPAAATIVNATSASATVTPAVAGTYTFQLTSSVNGDVLATDTVQLTAVTDTVAYMDSTCNGCHNPTTGNYPSNSFAGWSASAHKANAVNCVTCHTDGAMPTPVNTATVNPTSFRVLNASAGTVGTNYCSKCHNYIAITAHDAGAKADCAACHGFEAHSLARAAIAGTVTAKHVSGKYPAGGTAVNVGDAITEYVTQGATCADCHNSTNSMLTGFAAGGHGHVSDDPLNPFGHYDWSKRTNNGTRQNGNCDRCHTAGGFILFTGQDATLAARLAPRTNEPSNVLVCVSCHSSIETGALRTDATPAGNGKTLAEGYFALFSSSASSVAVGKTKIQVEFPGYKKSSICIPCHSGRTTDKVIIATIDQSKAALKNYTTISTGFYQHAFNMGQTFIGKGAYNFGGNDYVGANGHNAVANGAADNAGPCVGCHHSSADSHSLHVTGYSSCQSCHAAGFGAADVEAAKAKFDAGVKILTSLVEEKFNPLRVDQAKPISTERANVRFGRFGKAAGVAADEVTAKNAYGAWYNWHILTNTDPGAFVHNPTYARQILLSTIDYLDNAKVDDTAEATIAASTAVTVTEKEKAAAFLTPVCASCHASQTTLVQGGKHATEIAHYSGACGRCHTTEGYVTLAAEVAAGTKTFSGTYTTLYNGTQNVSCSACHDTHGTVRTLAGWAPKYAENDAAASNQFKLCTSCHNLVNETGSVLASGALVSGTQTVAKQQHYKDWYRNIASTHYDLASTGTVTNVGTVIEGYNVRFNKDSACTDCHGHELYTNTGKALEPASATDAAKGAGTIHTDWAQSGHAGALLKVKFQTFTTANPTRARNATNAAAVMATGVTATTGAAWEHYNWDDSTGTSSDRKACQKCHTATGLSNFLTAVAAKNTAGDQAAAVAYSAANNDFGHLAQWTTAKVSAQNEMLYCWGCHKSAETGELRVTGNMTLDYKATTADTSNIVINAPSKSAVCVSCHAGRGNAASLFGAATIDPTAVLGSTTTPKNSGTATSTHYLNAAATIFQAQTKVGYEFPNRSYANPAYYKHNTLGCNDCHMPSKSHKFDVVGKNAAGVVTSLKATNCVTCHTGAYGTALTAGSAAAAAFIEEEAEGYKQALAAFNAALIAQGYTWTSGYPYFAFTHADAATAALKWRKQGDLGAGHNYNYLLHEPGAYAHNRLYTKRLIYDSMDWLDNNLMDGSVVINAGTYPHAATWLGAVRP